MATKYGKTWWGQQWLGALKNIDYSNRLSRGASYAKNGMVKEIIFNGNVIKAKVKGSRRTPYNETIVLPIFFNKEIDKLIELIRDQPVVLSKLFNRQLDESVAQMADKAGIPLSPKEWSDLQMYCSCPAADSPWLCRTADILRDHHTQRTWTGKKYTKQKIPNRLATCND